MATPVTLRTLQNRYEKQEPITIITTTTLGDLAPRLVAASACQEVVRGPRGSEVKRER